MRTVLVVLAPLSLLLSPARLDAQPPRDAQPPGAPPAAAPALRVVLRAPGSGLVSPIVATPTGATIAVGDGTAGVTSGAATSDAGAWLEWRDEPAPGRYLICAVGEAGGGTQMTLEVTRHGRTGRREVELTGALEAPCTEQSTGFLVAVTIAAGTGSASPAASACADGRVTVSGGYCCWPGQRFDEGLGRCSGPPSCPAGYAAAGAECVAQAGAQPAAAPPPRARSSAPPPTRAAAPVGRIVTVRAQSRQSGLTLHRRSAQGPLAVIGPGFAATGQTTEYALVSRVPGSASLEEGDYQLAVALDSRLPIPAGGPMRLSGDVMLLDVSYEDRFPLNVTGYAVALVGVGLGVGLTTFALINGYVDVPMLVGGIVGGVVGLVAGFVLINLSDVATVRPAHEDDGE